MDKRNMVVAIDPETYCIEENNGAVYSYLLLGTERAVLIDTGMGSMDYRAVTDELTRLPVWVVNTHGHFDHIGANHQYDLACLHGADEPVYQDHSSYETQCGFYKEVMGEAQLTPEFREVIQRRCAMLKVENRRFLSDGDVLDLGGRTLEIIHTPGHTPGSICILDRQRGHLFSGDTVCAKGILLNLKYSCSVETFLGSIRKLQARRDDFQRIWPGHHDRPIDLGYLDDYEMCAQQLLDKYRAGNGTGSPDWMPQETFFHHRVLIAFTGDNIWDEEGARR